jgi:NAD+ kinase
LGNIGLLTEVQNPENTLDALKHVFNNRYHLDIRTLLRATIYRKGKKVKTFLALNEIVINQGNFARLIDLEAKMNQRKMVRFRADGVIVATATGSTGHSLSAGGPIVHPKLDAFVFTPICPATLSMCPIVLPSSRQLTISIETERRFEDTTVALTIDGQQTVALQYGDHIKIRSSQRQLHLARLSNTRYYKVLRDRLNWGD